VESSGSIPALRRVGVLEEEIVRRIPALTAVEMAQIGFVTVKFVSRYVKRETRIFNKNLLVFHIYIDTRIFY
jgi:hypothetical protein